MNRIRMHPAVTLLMLIGVTWLTSACDNARSNELTMQRVDSAGIEIVQSPRADVPLQWSFERVAAVDPEQSAAGVMQVNSRLVRTDAAGRIHVLDTSSPRIVVFDADGQFLRTQGRKGGGPGEVEFPLAIAVWPDGTSAMYDIAKRRLVRFDANGGIIDELPLQGYYGGDLALVSGRTLYTRQHVSDDGARAEQLVAVSQADTLLLAELPEAQARPLELESCGMAFSGMTPLFTPSLRWAASDNRIAVVDGAGYDVRIFDVGREHRRLRLPILPRAATADLAAAELGEAMVVRTERGVRKCDTSEVVEKRGFASHVPVISRIAVAPTGELWVERGSVGDEQASIDVFAEDGAYVGTLPAGTPFPAAFLPGGRIVSVEVDDLEVSHLVIFEVNRGDSA